MPPEAPEPRPAEGALQVFRRRSIWAGLAAVLAAAAVAAGAFLGSPAFRGPDSDLATLQGFQIRVLNVTQAAAENRLDGALAALDALEKDLDAAAGGGVISVSRYRGIEAALSAVRADITRTVEAQASAAAVATAAAAAAETPTADAAATQPQPVQPQPETPAVVPAPEPVSQGPVLPDAAKDAKGKGKGAGKP